MEEINKKMKETNSINEMNSKNAFSVLKVDKDTPAQPVPPTKIRKNKGTPTSDTKRDSPGRELIVPENLDNFQQFLQEQNNYQTYKQKFLHKMSQTHNIQNKDHLQIQFRNKNIEKEKSIDPKLGRRVDMNVSDIFSRFRTTSIDSCKAFVNKLINPSLTKHLKIKDTGKTKLPETSEALQSFRKMDYSPQQEIPHQQLPQEIHLFNQNSNYFKNTTHTPHNNPSHNPKSSKSPEPSPRFNNNPHNDLQEASEAETPKMKYFIHNLHTLHTAHTPSRSQSKELDSIPSSPAKIHSQQLLKLTNKFNSPSIAKHKHKHKHTHHQNINPNTANANTNGVMKSKSLYCGKYDSKSAASTTKHSKFNMNKLSKHAQLPCSPNNNCGSAAGSEGFGGSFGVAKLKSMKIGLQKCGGGNDWSAGLKSQGKSVSEIRNEGLQPVLPKTGDLSLSPVSLNQNSIFYNAPHGSFGSKFQSKGDEKAAEEKSVYKSGIKSGELFKKEVVDTDELDDICELNDLYDCAQIAQNIQLDETNRTHELAEPLNDNSNIDNVNFSTLLDIINNDQLPSCKPQPSVSGRESSFEKKESYEKPTVSKVVKEIDLTETEESSVLQNTNTSTGFWSFLGFKNFQKSSPQE